MKRLHKIFDSFVSLHKILGFKYNITLTLTLVLALFAALADASAAISSFALIATLTGKKVFSSHIIQYLTSKYSLTVTTSIFLFVLVSSLSALLRFFLYVSIEYHSIFSSSRLSYLLNLSSFNLSYQDFFSVSPSQRQSYAINYIDTVCLFIEDSLRLFSQLITVLLVVVTLLAVKPQYVAIITSTLVFVYIVYLLIVGPANRRLGVDYASGRTTYLSQVSDAYTGFRDILLHSSQDFYATRLQSSDLLIRNPLFYGRLLGNIPRYAIELFVYLIFLLFAFYVMYSGRSLTSLSSFLILLLLITQRLLPPIQSVYYSLSSLITWHPSVVKCLDSITSHPQSDYQIPLSVSSNQHALPYDSCFLEAHSVSLYRNNQYLFSDLDISLQTGDVLGIFGPSGSGKSTLCDLLIGLIPPSQGRVLLNGIPFSRLLTSSYSKTQWFSSIAYVNQAIFIENNSLKSNIAFGVSDDDINYDILQESTRLACIYDFIKSLPDSFDTVVGGSSLQLSGGQKQRIALARALYKGSSLLILDEATNALDESTQYHIFDNLHKTRDSRITIIVSHSQQCLSNCTSILSLYKHTYGTHTPPYSELG